MNGQIFYGLHMVKGVAEYPEKEHSNGEAYRVYISENTAKQMDTTFPGKPMFVEHVSEVVENDIKKESVGYVVESFFNKPDGNHWCKFIITDKAGITAIQQGYVLSNCYVGKGFGPGGEWHAVPYAKEVTTAEYEHLAITQKPRYKESIILTSEDFKKYNEEKEAELIRLSNSIKKVETDNQKKQEIKKMKFNFFKKEKFDNSMVDLEQMSVILPKSKKEMTIERLINSMDEQEMNSEEPRLVNGDDKVKVGDQEMTVNELTEKYNSMCKAKNSEEEEAKKKKDLEDEKAKNELEEEKEKNSDELEKEKEKNSDEEKKKADEKAQNSAHFERLSNAHARVASAPVTDFSWDQAARGKQKYGSNK